MKLADLNRLPTPVKVMLVVHVVLSFALLLQMAETPGEAKLNIFGLTVLAYFPAGLLVVLLGSLAHSMLVYVVAQLLIGGAWYALIGYGLTRLLAARRAPPEEVGFRK